MAMAAEPAPGDSPGAGFFGAYLPRLARAWARALPAMLRARLLDLPSRSTADACLATFRLVTLLVLDFLAIVCNLLPRTSGSSSRTSFPTVRVRMLGSHATLT